MKVFESAMGADVERDFVDTAVEVVGFGAEVGLEWMRDERARRRDILKGRTNRYISESSKAMYLLWAC